MELKGAYKGITVDYTAHSTLITFSTPLSPNEAEKAFEGLSDKELVLNIKEYSPKRSLNANAYFHTLCRELANKLHETEPFVKNKLIAEAGQVDYREDGNPWTIKTNVPLDEMWQQELLHVKPIKITIEKGNEAYWYAVMRPTHTYTVKEMSRLIESTVQDCKLQGIPTMSDAEMERLLDAWEKR